MIPSLAMSIKCFITKGISDVEVSTIALYLSNPGTGLVKSFKEAQLPVLIQV